MLQKPNLKNIIYGTVLKNTMERVIQQINDRTEYFENFATKKQICRVQHV